ncbi:MAG: tetratricopeptide repeat protein [Alphaproteobacteria bacterium]|nr:tetratricopeptide repeat protein [Alphaproteobacteria bacterium]
MLRLFLFIVIAGAAAWGVVWLTDNPGQVNLDWGGWKVQTSAGVLTVMVVLFAVAAALAYRAWLFVTRAPGRIGDARRNRRSQRGYKALTKGMVAVAAGDAEEALAQVKQADGLLGEPPLTLLLKAQAAQLNGDETAAEAFFTAMLDDPEMEFLGLRGLLNQAMKRGDAAVALDIARKAQALKPGSVWLTDTVFALEARAGTWSNAATALGRLDKSRALPAGVAKRRQAIVELGESFEAAHAGNAGRALKHAEKAVSLDGSLGAAAVRLAELYIANGRQKKAQSVLETAWKVKPHPALAEAYYVAVDANDGLKKASAAERLLSFKTDAEAHVVLGKAALEAELWGRARTHLGRALEAGRRTRSVYAMMARLEDAERGDKDKIRDWLSRAADAAGDPAWVCADCGHVEAHWSAHCPKCHGFDTLMWDTPPGYEGRVPAQVALTADEADGERALKRIDAAPSDD